MRQDQIIEAIQEENIEKLNHLFKTSNDEEEREFILKRIQIIDDSDWAHDRSNDNDL